MADFPTTPEYDLALSPAMVYCLHIGYTASVTILLLNLLIAMMNDTFQQVQTKARLQWKVEWASIIVMIERRLLPFQRRKYRSGKRGVDLGLNTDTHYLILEERVT